VPRPARGAVLAQIAQCLGKNTGETGAHPQEPGLLTRRAALLEKFAHRDDVRGHSRNDRLERLPVNPMAVFMNDPLPLLDIIGAAEDVVDAGAARWSSWCHLAL
jgi:hypothetical protein